MGGPELAVSMVVRAMESKCGVTFPNVQCSRAGDVAEHCRTVLAGHSGQLAPKCIFSEILGRCPPWKLRKLRSMMNMEKTRVRGKLAAAKSCDTGVKKIEIIKKSG
eukprot:9477843-Pyramimonas_sp.AAC.1